MNYDAINTKVRALKSRLLTISDYHLLCRVESVEALYARLNLNEEQLAQSMAGDLKNLQRILRFMGDSQGRRSLLPQIIQIESNFIKQQLRVARNTKEFINELRDTDFYNILLPVQEKGLFAMEMQMDLHYHLQAWESARRLTEWQNRAALMYIRGVDIDLHNIMWAYRYKRYYPDIYPLLIPVHYRLSKGALGRLIDSATPEALASELKFTPYDGVFGNFEEPEPSYVQAMRRILSVTARRYPRSVTTVVGYFFNKRVEMQNLTTIIEGLRYKLPADDIFRLLK